jgi:hypothetical protein
MKKSGKQGKKVFSVKRVRGGVPASSSLRAGTVKLTNANIATGS